MTLFCVLFYFCCCCAETMMTLWFVQCGSGCNNNTPFCWQFGYTLTLYSGSIARYTDHFRFSCETQGMMHTLLSHFTSKWIFCLILCGEQFHIYIFFPSDIWRFSLDVSFLWQFKSSKYLAWHNHFLLISIDFTITFFLLQIASHQALHTTFSYNKNSVEFTKTTFK